MPSPGWRQRRPLMASSTRREPRRAKGQAGDGSEVGRGAGQPTKKSRLVSLIAKGLSEDEARRIASKSPSCQPYSAKRGWASASVGPRVSTERGITATGEQ